jgi:transketolase
MQEALDALRKTTQLKGKPSVIIAHTVKGYPIINLLSDHNYHGKALPPDVAKKALAEIG